MNSHLHIARSVARLLDNQFEFMGLRFGLDPIIGIIPFFGDLVSLGLSAYIIWIGYQMRLPGQVLGSMLRNVVFDFVLGMIPVIGDVSDFFYKANLKNLALLEKYQNASITVDGEIVT